MKTHTPKKECPNCKGVLVEDLESTGGQFKDTHDWVSIECHACGYRGKGHLVLKTPVKVNADETNPLFVEMMLALEKGYLTGREKLEDLFFNPTEDPTIRNVVVKSVGPGVPRGRKEVKKNTTESRRYFCGQPTVRLVYPNSRDFIVHLARVRVEKNLCAIEPVTPNTAIWLTNRVDVENVDVVDLRTIHHERVYHCKSSKILFNNFR